MTQKELANFTVRIFFADNATRQGEVESDGEVFAFQREMQLCKKHPQLMPELGSNLSNG